MLTGEKRGLSARRGMTVLGKIPAAPKPINLPSQRLENRGLDPSIDLVPRGTVSWGSSGRSPPTSGSAWGNTAQSSVPASTGAWGVSGAKVTTTPGSNSSIGGWTATSSLSAATNVSRPLSAGSSAQSRNQSASSNAWGLPSSRPSSASGALGQGGQSQQTVARPRSAEMRTSGTQSSPLSRFSDSINEPPSVPLAWGGSGFSLKSEEQLQATRFTLTPVDFPTLGSEKNHDLRPQGRPLSADGARSLAKERRLIVHQEGVSTRHLGPYGSEARSMPDSWCKEEPPATGPSSNDGSWHGIDAASHVSSPAHHDSWCNEDNNDSGDNPVVSVGDDSWRPGAFRVGAYGPGQFHHDRFVHQPAPHGAMPYRRGGPGRGDYSRQSEIYGTSVQQPEIASEGPEVSVGTGLQYETYYGPTGTGPSQISQYRNMDEQEMMMLGMSGSGTGTYRNISQHSGSPYEHYNRHRYPVHGAGSRHLAMHSGRLRTYEGEVYSEIGHHEDYERQQDVQRHLRGGDSNDGSLKYYPGKDASETSGNMQKHGHGEWGAAVSNGGDPVDFPKPAFEDDVSSTLVSEACDTSDILLEEKSVRIRILRHNSAGHAIPEQDKSEEKNQKDERKNLCQLISKKALGESVSVSDGITQNKAAEVPHQVATREKYREDLSDNHDATDSVMLFCSGRNHEKQDNVVGSAASSIILKRAQQTPLRILAPTSKSFTSVETSLADPLVVSGSDFQNNVFDTEIIPPSGIKITRILQPDRKLGENFKSEFPNGNDKSEFLMKHNEEAQSDSLHTIADHTAHTELTKGSNMIRNSISKDDRKTKSRFNIHEGEKEWRAKSLVTQPKTEMSKPSAPQIGAPAAALVTTRELKRNSEKEVMKGDVEKRVVSDDVYQTENLQVGDAYDYESQRARLKEIAVQRSRQLQKEEEERTKEQRAKAQAKLDELNKRTLVSSNTGKPTHFEATIEENPTVSSTIDNSTDSVSALQHGSVSDEVLTVMIERAEDNKCIDSNRHGNCEQDGKDLKEQPILKDTCEEKKDSDGETVVSLDIARSTGPLQSSVSHHSLHGFITPVLEPPHSIQPEQVLLSHVASLQPHPATERNKECIHQTMEHINPPSKEHHASVMVSQNLEPSNEGTEGGREVACEAHPCAIQEAGANSGTNRGNTIFRKKRITGGNKNKHNGQAKNRNSAGAELAPPELKDQGENLQSGDTLAEPKKGMQDTGVKASGPGVWHGDNVNSSSPVLKFDFLVPDLSQEIAFGSVNEAIEKIPSDDNLNKKATRKFQPLCSLKERRSHDPRMIEKSPANEGLVWAVKSLSTPGVTGFEADINKTESSAENYQETTNMNNVTSSPNSYRSRRADLQRYNPKLASKYHRQDIKVRAQNTSNVYQPSNQRHGSFFQREMDSRDSSLNQSNVAKSFASTDSKHDDENHLNETAGGGRTHASWKQRNPIESNGTERNFERGEGELLQPRQIEVPKKNHINLADVTIQKASQRIFHQVEIDQLHTEGHPSQDFSTGGQNLQDNIPSIDVVNSLQPKIAKQNAQRNYQRSNVPTDNATLRYKEDMPVTRSEKEMRNARRDPNRRTQSTNSHVHSMEEPSVEKDSINSDIIDQDLQKPLTGSSETCNLVASRGKEWRQVNGAASCQLQGKGSAPEDQVFSGNSKKGRGNSLWRQQGKHHYALSNSPDLSESILTAQQHDKNCQISKQQEYSDLQKDHGNLQNSLQKKQGLNHLQWQQNNTSRVSKLPIIDASEDVMATDVSVVDSQFQQSSSVSKQRPPFKHFDHPSLNDARKIQSQYSQVQKQYQPDHHVESQSRHVPKQKYQLLPAPADGSQGHSSQTPRSIDRGEGVYFRPKDHKPLRRGHYRFSGGGRGPDDVDRRQNFHKQGITFDATVDSA